MDYYKKGLIFDMPKGKTKLTDKEYKSLMIQRGGAFHQWDKKRYRLPIGQQSTEMYTPDPNEEFRKYELIPYWYCGKESQTIITFEDPLRPYVKKLGKDWRTPLQAKVRQSDGTKKNITKRPYEIHCEIYGEVVGFPPYETHHVTQGDDTKDKQRIPKTIHRGLIKYLQTHLRANRTEKEERIIMTEKMQALTEQIELYRAKGEDKCMLVIDNGLEHTSVHAVDTDAMIESLAGAKNFKQFMTAYNEVPYIQKIVDFVNIIMDMKGVEFFNEDRYTCVYFNEDCLDFKCYKITKQAGDKIRVNKIKITDIPKGIEKIMISKDKFFIPEFNNTNGVKFDW